MSRFVKEDEMTGMEEEGSEEYEEDEEMEDHIHGESETTLKMDPNQPKSMVDDYHESVAQEKQANTSERMYYIRSIRALLEKNPKIDPFKRSKFQDRFDQMTVEELKESLDSCKDQSGISNVYAIPEVVVGLMDAVLRKKTGYCISEDFKKDTAILALAENYLPSWIRQFSDQFQLMHRLMNCIQKIEVKEIMQHTEFTTNTIPSQPTTPSPISSTNVPTNVTN